MDRNSACGGSNRVTDLAFSVYAEKPERAAAQQEAFLVIPVFCVPLRAQGAPGTREIVEFCNHRAAKRRLGYPSSWASGTCWGNNTRLARHPGRVRPGYTINSGAFFSRNFRVTTPGR